MGLDTKRIINSLNSNNYKTFKILEWIPKLVYMNRQKYLKRLKRLNDHKIVNTKEQLVIRQLRVFETY